MSSSKGKPVKKGLSPVDAEIAERYRDAARPTPATKPKPKPATKKLYIALDYAGKVLSVLLANARDEADLVWTGMGVYASSVEELDPAGPDLPRVVCLLSSQIKTVRLWDGSQTEMVVLKRGMS